MSSDLACTTGNDPAHVWCAPCRRGKVCLGLPKMRGPDVFTFQPLTGARLSLSQAGALDMMGDGPGRYLAVEVCDRYATLLALWRRGLIRCVEESPHLGWETSYWVRR